MALVVEESGGFERIKIPPRVYRGGEGGIKSVTVAGFRLHELPSRDKPGEKDKVIFWEFTITSNAGKEMVLEGMTAAYIGPRNNLRKWIKALTGADPSGSIDLESFIGHPCTINVEDRTKDKEEYSIVESILPGSAPVSDEIPF